MLEIIGGVSVHPSAAYVIMHAWEIRIQFEIYFPIELLHEDCLIWLHRTDLLLLCGVCSHGFMDRAIVSYIWGKDPCNIVNALISGASFLNSSNARRVLIAYEDVYKGPYVDLLRLYWEVRPAMQDFVVDEAVVGASTQPRLNRVYNKLSVLKHAETIAKVVLLADLDVMATDELDGIWKFIEDSPDKIFAGSMRGAGIWPLDRPRERNTLFNEKGDLKGGVNGGILLLKTSQDLVRRLENFLVEEWRPQTDYGADQDFWTVFFQDSQIWPLSRDYNFQLHQTHLNGVTWLFA